MRVAWYAQKITEYVCVHMYVHKYPMCCEIFLWVRGYLKIDYIFATVFTNCHFPHSQEFQQIR